MVKNNKKYPRSFIQHVCQTAWMLRVSPTSEFLPDSDRFVLFIFAASILCFMRFNF